MRQARRWWVALFTVAVLVAMTACSGSKDDSDSNETAHAASLIDQKQYSEAIYVLDEYLKTMPGDPHARVLLASAFASRAGLQLSTYEKFAFDLAKWDQIDKLVPVQNDGTLLGQISVIANTAVKVDIIIGAFNDLPNPSGPEGIKDLQAAVDALSEGNALSGGPSLYRAMLRAVIFKYDLQHGYKQELLNPPGQDETVACQVISGRLEKWFSAIGSDLDGILLDAKGGLAAGDQQNRVAQVEGELQKDITSVAKILALPRLAKGSLDLPPGLQQIYGTCQP